MDLVEGVWLGAFRLGRRIALGGMGEVWIAAEHLADGSTRPVALKMLHPSFAGDRQARDMFLDEVSIATQLVHENIVRVHGGHEEGGVLFQAMELVDGWDLRRIVSRVQHAKVEIPIPIALWVVREMARALGHAHERRGVGGRPLEIVHRDVSPHNVMITRTGEIRLLDFGIARAAERLTRTNTGVIKGKVAYMAPEQALALPATPKTDIFSTGMVLWELLTMSRAFDESNQGLILERVARADVRPILEVNPRVPREVAEFLGRMLALDPGDRPASMAVVENFLSSFLSSLGELQENARREIARWVAPFLDSEERKTARLELAGIDLAPTIEEVCEAPWAEPSMTSLQDQTDTATYTATTCGATRVAAYRAAHAATGAATHAVPHEGADVTQPMEVSSTTLVEPGTTRALSGFLPQTEKRSSTSSATRVRSTAPAGIGVQTWRPVLLAVALVSLIAAALLLRSCFLR